MATQFTWDLAVLLIAVWWLYSIARLLLNGRWWVWEFTTIVPPAINLLLLVASTGLVVWWGVGWLTLLLVFPLIVWLPDSDIHLPKWRSSSKTAQVRLLTWNTSYWHSTNDPQQFASFLTAQHADIYVLQEALFANDDHRQVQAEVQQWFPNYFALQHGELVIISRFPISNLRAGDPELPWSNFMAVDLEVQDQILTLFNVHIPVPFRPHDLGGNVRGQNPKHLFKARQAAMRELLSAVKSTHHPHLLAGDFNTIATQALIAPLARTHAEAFASTTAGVPATFKFGPFRLWRLDWVFGSRQIEFNSYQVKSEAGLSDHSAVVVEFTITA